MSEKPRPFGLRLASQRWKPIYICIARTCTNNSKDNPKLPFFPLPCSREKFDIWIEKAHRSDLKKKFNPNASTIHFLCADHFESKFFSDSKRTKIRPNVEMVPTIFTDNCEKKFHVRTPKRPRLAKRIRPENTMEIITKKIINVEQEYCRLCAKLLPLSCLESIYNNPNVNYSDMIETCLPGKLREDDNLPHLTCTECGMKLVNCFYLIKGFLKADSALHIIYSSSIISSHKRRLRPKEIDEIREEVSETLSSEETVEYRLEMDETEYSNQNKTDLIEELSEEIEILEEIVDDPLPIVSDEISIHPEMAANEDLEDFEEPIVEYLDFDEAEDHEIGPGISDVIATSNEEIQEILIPVELEDNPEIPEVIATNNEEIQEIIELEDNSEIPEVIDTNNEEIHEIIDPVEEGTFDVVVQEATTAIPEDIEEPLMEEFITLKPLLPHVIIKEKTPLLQELTEEELPIPQVIIEEEVSIKEEVQSLPEILLVEEEEVPETFQEEKETIPEPPHQEEEQIEDLPEVHLPEDSPESFAHIPVETFEEKDGNRFDEISQSEIDIIRLLSDDQHLITDNDTKKLHERKKDSIELSPETKSKMFCAEKTAIKTNTQCQVEVKYQCTICNQLFNTKQEVVSHSLASHPEIESDIYYRDVQIITNNETLGDLSCNDQTELKYQCTECNSVFNSKEEFVDHSLKKHQDNQEIVCKPIGVNDLRRKGYKNRDDFEVKYQCTVCNCLFDDTQDVIDHSINQHPENQDKIMCRVVQVTNVEEFNENELDNTTQINYQCTLCNKLFKSRKEVVSHSLEAHPGNMDRIVTQESNFKKTGPGISNFKYQCSICDQLFDSKKEVGDHSFSNHPENQNEVLCRIVENNKNSAMIKYQCTSCHMLFLNKSEVAQHTLKTHPEHKDKIMCKIVQVINYASHNYLKDNANEIKYQCNLCSDVFSTTKELFGHTSEKHPENKDQIICKVVQLINNPDGFKSEVNEDGQSVREKRTGGHIESIRFECLKCSSLHTTKVEFIKHSIFVHDEENTQVNIVCRVLKSGDKSRPQQINCLKCSVICSSFRSYRKHLEDHYEFSCTECGAKFNNQLRLNHHTNQGHIIYDCADCGEKFYTEMSLKTHQNIHKIPDLGKEIFGCSTLCNICGKIYHSPAALKMHLKTHADSRQYSCAICNLSFSTRGTLRRHKYLHEPNKGFVCEVCGKQFKQPHVLKFHKTIHQPGGSKRFLCELCNTFFSTKIAVVKHKLMHATLDDFTCKFCNETFTNKIDYKQHKAIHEDEKLHQCKECCKRFWTVFRLKMHMKVHSRKAKQPKNEFSQLESQNMAINENHITLEDNFNFDSNSNEKIITISNCQDETNDGHILMSLLSK